MGTTNLEAEFDPKTVDRILSALSHEYNRSVMNYFRESPDSIAALDKLADYVATKSTGIGSSEEVALRLHHAGLPKIADAGILDYDPRTKTVRRRDHPLLESSELLEIA
jgi:hypothetical protein